MMKRILFQQSSQAPTEPLWAHGRALSVVCFLWISWCCFLFSSCFLIFIFSTFVNSLSSSSIPHCVAMAWAEAWFKKTNKKVSLDLNFHPYKKTKKFKNLMKLLDPECFCLDQTYSTSYLMWTLVVVSSQTDSPGWGTLAPFYFYPIGFKAKEALGMGVVFPVCNPVLGRLRQEDYQRGL